MNRAFNIDTHFCGDFLMGGTREICTPGHIMTAFAPAGCAAVHEEASALFGRVAFGDGLQQKLQRSSIRTSRTEIIYPHIPPLPFDQDTGFLFGRVLDGSASHIRVYTGDFGDVGLDTKLSRHATLSKTSLF